jgi:hypothetical protein
MTDEQSGVSRRRFLATTLATLGVESGLAGCSALPDNDDPLDAPDYDMDAVKTLFQKGFPSQPNGFPVEVPTDRLDVHRSRTRELLDSVPASPDIPNEAVANQIAQDRKHLTEQLGEREPEPRPLQQLDRWRYYRGSAAEIWGAYAAATNQYDRSEFQERYEQLRTNYLDFEEMWDYRGADPIAALVLHRTLERLFSRGEDDVLSSGPFPRDPQSAVFQAGRLIRDHETATATLGDARALRSRYLADQSAPPSQRLRFVATSKRLFRSFIIERRPDTYEDALEEGREALGLSLEHGPDAAAFQSARRYAMQGDRIVREAWQQNDPAEATFRAARIRITRPAFRETVDAILEREVTLPGDVEGLRALRSETVDRLQEAWCAEPRPIAVELSAIPLDILGAVSPRRYERYNADLDDHDIAEYVGTLHHAKRVATLIPQVATLVDETLDDV